MIQRQIALAQVAAPQRAALAQQHLGLGDNLGIVGVLHVALFNLPLPPFLLPAQRAVYQRPLVARVEVQRVALPPQLDEAALLVEQAIKALVGQPPVGAVPKRDPCGGQNLRLHPYQRARCFLWRGERLHQP